MPPGRARGSRQVLISAGISSPDLRFAAEQGVDIEEAGHADYAMAVVVLGPLQLCLESEDGPGGK